MIQKPLPSITWDDIEGLARQNIPESTSLEFKAEPIKDNVEVARDVSAMGNGGGGDIIIGVPETNGIAQPPKPFPRGEAEGSRIIQVVAAGVSPYPRAISTRAVSGPGGDVVIIRVPRSRTPLMVHLYGQRTEFWVRRDRQKSMMTQGEIVSAVRVGMEQAKRREDFIDERIDRFLQQVPGLSLFLSVSPMTPVGTRVVPVRDDRVQAVMRDQSGNKVSLVWGVDPRASLYGLAGTVGNKYFLEVHHDGHIEVRFFAPSGLTREFSPGALPAGTIALIGDPLSRSVVEIVRRARRVFDLSGIFEEFIITLVLGKAGGTVLIRPNVAFYQDHVVAEDLGVRWNDPTLKIQEPGFVDDPHDMSAKRMCDRLWQTYGRWDCPLFDADGRFGDK